MESEVFIKIEECNLSIFTEEHNVNIAINRLNYFDYEEYISIVIHENLKKLDIKVRGISLILGDYFFSYSERKTVGVRGAIVESYKVNNFSMPIDETYNTDETNYIESYTNYVSEGIEYKRLEEIPAFQKYIKTKANLTWKNEKINALIYNLAKYGLNVDKMLPISYFCNAFMPDYKGSNAIVSIGEKKTTITLFKNGFIRGLSSLSFGIDDLRIKISNDCGISYNNSNNLIQMYGLLVVPSQFVNYQISIPIYDDVCTVVKLCDISFEIRTFVKEKFGILYKELKKYKVKEVFFNNLTIEKADSYFQMMTKLNTIQMPELTYTMCSQMFSTIRQNKYSEILTPIKPKEDELKDTESKIETTIETVQNNNIQEQAVWQGISEKFQGAVNSLSQKLNQILTE